MPFRTGRSPSARPVLPSQLAPQMPAPAPGPVNNNANNNIQNIGGGWGRGSDGTIYEEQMGGGWFRSPTNDFSMGISNGPAGNPTLSPYGPPSNPMAQPPAGLQAPQPASAPVMSAPAPVPPPTGQMPRSYGRMTPRSASAPQSGGIMNLAPQQPAPYGPSSNSMAQPPAAGLQAPQPQPAPYSDPNSQIAYAAPSWGPNIDWAEINRQRELRDQAAALPASSFTAQSYSPLTPGSLFTQPIPQLY